MLLLVQRSGDSGSLRVAEFPQSLRDGHAGQSTGPADDGHPAVSPTSRRARREQAPRAFIQMRPQTRDLRFERTLIGHTGTIVTSIVIV